MVSAGVVALLVAGILALYVGAELLVAAAARIGGGLGLRAATVGVTLIAFATTTPELFVATVGAVTVSTDIGLGAIVGSNIANIGLVLGVAALIRPLEVTETVLRRHVPVMVLAALLLVVVSVDGVIGPLEGSILLVVLAAFTWFLLRVSGSPRGSSGDTSRLEGVRARDLLAAGGGILALLLGSRWLIDGGHAMLAAFGFSDLVIGLTIIAFGTSLPELAASAVGALRDQSEFAIGNVVGSNIYNILAVVGILSLGVPISVSASTLRFELPLLVVFTLLLVGLMGHNRKLSRLDGAVLLVAYVVFVWLLLGQ